MTQVEEVVRWLLETSPWRERVVHAERLPAREAEYGELSRPLPEPLQAALGALGIHRLYSHQVEAIEAARRGEDWLLLTGTASGKTLGYNLPILERILAEPETCALYLFPLKALAQDQRRKLEEMGLLALARFATYDGDTPEADRRAIRRTAQLVLTNPDMLHVGILPCHRLWARFFSRLRYVVLDELHMYRGLFGSHVANILQRLERVCALYGSRPQYLCASATVGEPEAFAQRLLGRPVRLISQDGSPGGARWILLWNPPWLGRAAGVRRSPHLEAADLLALLMQAGVRTLVFTLSRVATELILRYTRERLLAEAPPLVERLSPYRAGYLPEQRREIEARLFSGELLGVVSTVALEAGIDVGGLDASILTGYPGSIASFWQQVGRAGRGQGTALNILIALNNPVDQFFLRHPERLLREPIETLRINPRNIYILGSHLLCAAYEAPLREEDLARFGPEAPALVRLFEEEHLLVPRNQRWMWNGLGHPASWVNLRSATTETFRLLDASQGGALLGTLERSRVPTTVYPGALYLHGGETYRVVHLDTKQKEVWLEPVQSNEYTTPIVRTNVDILRVPSRRRIGSFQVGLGDVLLRQETVGYRRLEQATERLLEICSVAMEPEEYETTALWIALPPKMEAAYREKGLHLLGGMHGAEHALVAMLPLLAWCDVRDLGGVSLLHHSGLGMPALFLYDAHPGGMGLVEAGFEEFSLLVEMASAAVEQCPCEAGCPGCIQSPFCGSGNQPLDKAAAKSLLRSLLEAGQGLLSSAVA